MLFVIGCCWLRAYASNHNQNLMPQLALYEVILNRKWHANFHVKEILSFELQQVYVYKAHPIGLRSASKQWSAVQDPQVLRQ